ncbi:MAG: efflux RND transporter permease subunit [Pirellulales bacterium]
MPDSFDATKQLEQFVGLFGSDELLMISWDDCTLDDPRISDYSAQLLAPVDNSSGSQPLFRSVFTGPDILEYYESDAIGIEREEALRKMTGWILSSDHHQTCLVALVSEAGAKNRHAAIKHAREIAFRVTGLDADSVRFAGPTIEGVAIDEASIKNLLLLNAISFAFSLTIMVICLKSIRAAVLIFLIALLNEHISLAVIYYCGTELNSILLLTANLTFVLSISIGIHLFNYYKDALLTHDPLDAPLEACRQAFAPTFLATITTAIGLLSLTTSEINPIVSFGTYSAICIIISMCTTLVYISLHFRIWPLKQHLSEKDSKKQSKTLGHSLFGVQIVYRSRYYILFLAAFVLTWGYYGVQQLRTSVGLQELISSDTRVVQDYHWLEEKIGPLVPIELVLEMPSGDARTLMSQARTIEKLHQNLQLMDHSNAVISFASFTPTLPPDTASGFRQIARAAAFRRRLLSNQNQLSDLGYLKSQGKNNYWRITVRAPAIGKVDYGEVFAQVEETLNSTLSDEKLVQPLDVFITGGVPLIHEAQQQLLEDLIQSFLIAFCLVSFVLMILFRSVICGLICMIPNVLPSACVFGLMGWQDTPIEIGAILTASTAMGIAVDDSLHFITWFRRKLREGGTIKEAVVFAYSHCARAMLQTTLICTLGLLVFGASDFLPIVKFSWCMFALLSLAIIADLVVLPAILLSPFGKPFVPAAQTSYPQPIQKFAFQMAKVEFVINVIINLALASLVYIGCENIPLVGPLSLLVYLGPMFFLLPFIATFFGYFNGCSARKKDLATPEWKPNTIWKTRALLSGFYTGVIICLFGTSFLLLLNFCIPGIIISKWMAVAAISVTSGMLGYLISAYSITCSGRLGLEKSTL